MNEKNVSKKKLLKSYFWKILFLLILMAAFILVLYQKSFDNIGKKILLVIISILVLMQFVNLLLTIKQYKNYKYSFNIKEVVLKKGVIFKSTTIIPFCQIQDISYVEGPIDLLLNLSSVIISTAGPVEAIYSLDKQVALELVEELKKQINENSCEG